MTMHTYNPNAQEMEAGRSEIQGHLWYIASLRLAWATRDPVFSHKNQFSCTLRFQGQSQGIHVFRAAFSLRFFGL